MAAASLGRAFCTSFSIFRTATCTGDQPHRDSTCLPRAVTHRLTESGARPCQKPRHWMCTDWEHKHWHCCECSNLTLLRPCAQAQTTHQQKTPIPPPAEQQLPYTGHTPARPVSLPETRHIFQTRRTTMSRNLAGRVWRLGSVKLGGKVPLCSI